MHENKKLSAYWVKAPCHPWDENKIQQNFVKLKQATYLCVTLLGPRRICSAVAGAGATSPHCAPPWLHCRCAGASVPLPWETRSVTHAPWKSDGSNAWGIALARPSSRAPGTRRRRLPCLSPALLPRAASLQLPPPASCNLTATILPVKGKKFVLLSFLRVIEHAMYPLLRSSLFPIKKKKKLAVPLHLYVVIYMATMFLALLLLTFE